MTNAANRAWSLMTKTHNGTVSMLRDLTLDETRQAYEALDPFWGHYFNTYVYPDGTHPTGGAGGSGGTGQHVRDSDIVQREVFGPPGWDKSEINKWDHWPKERVITIPKPA